MSPETILPLIIVVFVGGLVLVAVGYIHKKKKRRRFVRPPSRQAIRRLNRVRERIAWAEILRGAEELKKGVRKLKEEGGFE